MNYPHPATVSRTRKPRVVWYIVSSKASLSKVVAEWLSIWPPAWRHLSSADQLDGVGHGIMILIERRTFREHPQYADSRLAEAIERATKRGAQVVELDIDRLKGIVRP